MIKLGKVGKVSSPGASQLTLCEPVGFKVGKSPAVPTHVVLKVNQWYAPCGMRYVWEMFVLMFLKYVNTTDIIVDSCLKRTDFLNLFKFWG